MVVPCFAPDDDCVKQYAYEVDKSIDAVDVMAHAFTLPRITEVLMSSAKRGVKLRVLTDRVNAVTRAGRKQLDEIASYADVRVECSVPVQNARVTIVDNYTVITGSADYSKAGFEKNSENMLVVRDNATAYAYAGNFARRWSASKPYLFGMRPCVRSDAELVKILRTAHDRIPYLRFDVAGGRRRHGRTSRVAVDMKGVM